MMQRLTLCGSAACLVWSLAGVAQDAATAPPPPLQLLADGASEYVIVRPLDSSPSQAYAAEELSGFIERMSGARLAIATDDAPLPPKAILLGLTRHTPALLGGAPDMAALGDDGFRLCVRSPHLLILGSPVRGTLYGVYELLEKHAGCRWYASYHSVIAERQDWLLPAALDETQVPAFVMREPFWWDMFQGDFAARCKVNGNRAQLGEKHGGHIRFGGGMFVHTFFPLMPPAEFFATHPEYYSEIDGQRKADHTQLCLTNPDVVRIMTERVLERIRKDPTAKLFSVSQNDWAGYCTCANCRAIDEREGSPAGTLILFVNQVAEAVEKEFPHAWIETLAYQYTRTPPKTVRPRHNVVPRLCSIECDFSKPLDLSAYEQNVKFVNDIRGWSALTDKLYVWDYVTNFSHYIGPHPNFACLQGNAKFFRDNHVVGLFEQGNYQSPHGEFAELRAWVLAKLLWNPDQDVESLYRDFFNGFYGPAAAPVRSYFDELHAPARDPEYKLRIFGTLDAKVYPDEFFERAAQTWAEAERRVADEPRFLYNVRMGAIPVLYTRYVRRQPGTRAWQWSDGRLRLEVADAEHTTLAADLIARLNEGKVTHAAEGIPRQHAFFTNLLACTDGVQPLELSGSGLHAAVAPEVGARVCLLRRGDGPSCLHPSAGGMELTMEGRTGMAWDTTTYRVVRKDDSSVQMEYGTHWLPWRTQQKVEFADGRLVLTGTAISTRTEASQPAPLLKVALDLGDVTQIAVQPRDRDWRRLTLPEGARIGTLSLAAAEAETRELLLASTLTRRGVRIRFPDIDAERVWIWCDRGTGAVRLFVRSNPASLDGQATMARRVEIEPLDEAPGLDRVPAAAAADPATSGFIVEDFVASIGKYGQWGETVRDADALDGLAAKLFGTHYEWCLQWRFDPAWFEPGATYRLEVRVRVEKGAHEGEAFWAGVYDAVRKTGMAAIEPRTQDVGDGYQWYDVGAWVPEQGQYVWVGPGRFDLKDGATSAIQAVYVDCFRLTRVQP